MKIKQIASLLLFFLGLAAIGWGWYRVTGDADTPVEEFVESILESQIESAAGLPDDSLNIDLSPGSKERREENRSKE